MDIRVSRVSWRKSIVFPVVALHAHPPLALACPKSMKQFYADPGGHCHNDMYCFYFCSRVYQSEEKQVDEAWFVFFRYERLWTIVWTRFATRFARDATHTGMNSCEAERQTRFASRDSEESKSRQTTFTAINRDKWNSESFDFQLYNQRKFRYTTIRVFCNNMRDCVSMYGDILE